MHYAFYVFEILKIHKIIGYGLVLQEIIELIIWKYGVNCMNIL